MKNFTFLIWKLATKKELFSQSELDTLNSEQKEFGDLALLTNLEESYSGLARKTLSSIQFAHENFDAQYLLKVKFVFYF